MTHTGILTRVEIESMGPPALEELREADVPASFLCDLALKHVAQMPEPHTRSISEELKLPRALVEEILVHLSREKMIEVKGQIAVRATRCSTAAGIASHACATSAATSARRQSPCATTHT